jgi:hypothetical protein
MRGGSLGKLPSVELLLLDSLTHVNTGDVKEGKPVALLYFSPDCEHCQNETRSILDHMDSLREVKFYFITNDSLDKLRIFRSIFRLDKYSNITLGWDNQFLFPRQFKGAYPPYLALYDRQLKQVGVFNGEVEASKIIALINN